jgi:hypothetical protein
MNFLELTMAGNISLENPSKLRWFGSGLPLPRFPENGLRQACMRNSGFISFA